MYLDIEKSQILSAPVQWVLFAIRNTDIDNDINKGKLLLTTEDGRRYSGRMFGCSVTLEILGGEELAVEGEINISTEVKAPLFLGYTSSIVRYKYSAIDDQSTLLALDVKLSTRGVFMALYGAILKRSISEYVSRILHRMEQTAKRLNENDERLCKLLTEEQMMRVNKYRKMIEESLAEPAPNDNPQVKPLSTEVDTREWGAELQELVGLYDGFQGKAHALKDELSRITEARDAVATLLTSRRMLEVIVTRLCTSLLGRPRGTEPLAGIIDKLNKIDTFPDNICTSMRNLNRLSTYGAHPKDFSTRQVREALIALCTITEWYIGSIVSVEIEGMDDSPTSQYRNQCISFYVNSVPTPEQRQILESERDRLGLSREEAARIEKEVTPPEIREIQTAIETVYADGMINENERLFLENKAKELSIHSSLAERLIAEYCDTVQETIEAKYQTLCQQFYSDSYPTTAQRQEMEQMRQMLGISKSQAAAIENSCVPQEIREFRVAVEAVNVDGKVGTNEQQFLDTKARELGLAPELATRIQEEYSGGL